MSHDLVERARAHARRERLRGERRREQLRLLRARARALHAPTTRRAGAEIRRDSPKNPACNPHRRFAWNSGHEVRGRHVERDPRREREPPRGEERYAWRIAAPSTVAAPRHAARRRARASPLRRGRDWRWRAPREACAARSRGTPARPSARSRVALAIATPSTTVCSRRPTNAELLTACDTACVSSPKWKCVASVCCVRCTARKPPSATAAAGARRLRTHAEACRASRPRPWGPRRVR